MNRREALRLLAAGAAVPLAPRGVMAILREARAAVGVKNDRRTLTPHQCVTVRAMAEMILPATETPGAANSGACEFVDLMLTEWYEPAEKERFLRGLADLDARAEVTVCTTKCPTGDCLESCTLPLEGCINNCRKTHPLQTR